MRFEHNTSDVHLTDDKHESAIPPESPFYEEEKRGKEGKPSKWNEWTS